MLNTFKKHMQSSIIRATVILALMLGVATLFEFLPIVTDARTMFPKNFSKDISCHEILTARSWYGQINPWAWLWFITTPVIVFSLSPKSSKWQLALRSLIAIALGYVLFIVMTYFSFEIRNAPFHGNGIVKFNGVVTSSLADQIKLGCFDIADGGPNSFALLAGWIPTMIYTGWCEIAWDVYHKYRTKLIDASFRRDWVNKIIVATSVIVPSILLILLAAKFLL